MKNWNKILPDFENGLLGPKINNKKYMTHGDESLSENLSTIVAEH